MNIENLKEKLCELTNNEITDACIESEGFQNILVTFRHKRKKICSTIKRD